MEISKVFDIQELAQEFMHSPKVEMSGKNAVLMYDYETESGDYKWTGITFLGVLDYWHTSESNVSEYMLEAYNALTVVKDSNWMDNSKFVSCIQIEDKEINHYLIYFDGYGAYEFICTGAIQGIEV